MAADESETSLYRVLVDKCGELEANHAKLNEQLSDIALEKQQRSDGGRRESLGLTSCSGELTAGLLPRYLKAGKGRSPYEHVLQSIGHAVHVTTASSGAIAYWNRSAERLYGWKDYEVIGRGDSDFLVDNKYVPAYKKIIEGLHLGHSWSGQFPFRRRSGLVFVAIVTKSPLYEDDELVGFVTVSSDVALFNNGNTSLRTNKDHGDEGPRRPRWQQLPQIRPVPHIASSVSNLASEVLSRKHGDGVDNPCATSTEGVESVSDAEDVSLKNPKAAVAKIFSKLNIKRNNPNLKEKDGNSLRGASFNVSQSNQGAEDPCFSGISRQISPCNCCGGAKSPSLVSREEHLISHKQRISSGEGETTCSRTLSKDCNGCFEDSNMGTALPNLRFQSKEQEHGLENKKTVGPEGDNEHLPVIKQFPSPGGSSNGSSSSKGDHELCSVVDNGIQWADLQLGEEVGQGSYAVVYRGLWNGSDVAIKVFFGNQYTEGTLLDYRKEIDIMRRLRHPNVLLFMGACFSDERLAIVTEFLPRGSLFKTLHRSNLVLDVKRRLRMALDVARGMNYLHRRNPPIIHRDLKSSNLLVDKNWTVKVGDFGLSRLKDATLMSAKSGLGTPQWMAPEVLRNEPSNEKSDVFSFGVILWELMTASIPWNNLNPIQVVGVVGFMDRRLDVPEGLDPRISSIISDCWQSKPDPRPSFHDIIHRMTRLLRNAQ